MTCNLDSCTNRLGVPPNAEVELAAGAVSSRCRERDERHMEHMRERVMMMMMMMMVMQLMTIVSILPTHARMRLGYVKTKKRFQTATRSANAGIVTIDSRRRGRQVRQGDTSMQTLVAIWQ